jgi:hypothetical protein
MGRIAEGALDEVVLQIIRRFHVYQVVSLHARCEAVRCNVVNVRSVLPFEARSPRGMMTEELIRWRGYRDGL